MSRFNTGNPLGSGSPLDLDDNAKNLDEAVNSSADTFQDRLGKSRLTWAGMESELRTSIALIGYQFVGDYAAGIEITQYNQLIRDSNGEFWRVSGQVDLPYVTTGTGLPEDDAFVPAGDAVLRQDLANGTGPTNGAALVGYRGRTVSERLDDTVNAADYGFSATNTAAANGAIVNALIALSDAADILLPFAAPLEGVVINKGVRLYSPQGTGLFPIQTSGSFGIKLVRGAVGAVVDGVSPQITNTNQTQIIIDGREGTGSAPQLNRFYNLNTESGKISTETWDGSVALLLADTWSNSFFGCHFNRPQTGIVLGYSGGAENSVNANHFYGCELRSVSTYTNGGRAILQYGGEANAWIGGIIENWAQQIEVRGGSLSICSGAYVEAFASGSSFDLHAGTLKVDGCFLNSPFVFIYGESQLIYCNNTVRTALTNTNYPIVQHRANVVCDVTMIGNKPKTDEPTGYFLREGEWRNSGGTWSALTAGLKFLQNLDQQTLVAADIVADLPNVTGDGTEYPVALSAADIVSDDLSEWSGASMTPRSGGMYELSGALSLYGITGDCTLTIYVRVGSGANNHTATFQKVLFTQTTSGIISVPLSVQFPCKAGQTVQVRVSVAGLSKVVGIRGRSGGGGVNRNSSFSIKRIK